MQVHALALILQLLLGSLPAEARVAEQSTHNALHKYGGEQISSSPRAWQFDKFVSTEDVEEIIRAAKSPSTGWAGCGNQEHVTKKHCAQLPVVHGPGFGTALWRLRSRLAKLWGDHVNFMETFAVLRYLPGSDATPLHLDHFENEEGVADMSLMLYLTAAPPGTATLNFPYANISNNAADPSSGLWIDPVPGRLVAWSNQKHQDGLDVVDAAAKHQLGGLPASAPAARYALQVSLPCLYLLLPHLPGRSHFPPILLPTSPHLPHLRRPSMAKTPPPRPMTDPDAGESASKLRGPAQRCVPLHL